MFQPFENFAYYLLMFLKVSVIDEDIIHVDCYLSFSYEVREYRVHEGLEGGWAVGHTKVHYFRLIQSLISDYCPLPFITFVDANVVVPPSNIEFCEILCFCQSIDNVGCQG